MDIPTSVLLILLFILVPHLLSFEIGYTTNRINNKTKCLNEGMNPMHASGNIKNEKENKPTIPEVIPIGKRL